MLNYTLGTIEASEALIKDLYIDLRAKVNAWSKITQQTPQARMGYVGQHLVSVVTGYPGGKSGARGYDLVIDDERHGEIKTCYRVDQLGSCNACGAVVSSLETECAVCRSTSINRKDDSKWLIAIRNNDEFAKLLDPYRYYFVLFEFESIYDSNNNDIIASIWEVDPKSKGFAYCMIDYYLNIRSQSTSKAPFNMWPHMLKFALTEPTLIYRSKITNDGNIITDVFPSKNNTYSDVLLPLSSYSGSTKLTCKNEGDLNSSLTMKQKETFEKFKDCTSELSCITECEAFSSGFILATRIMAEVMQGLEEAENMLQTTVISKL